MIEVPEIFTQPHPQEYPDHNDVIFEDWYFRNWTEEDKKERIYIPIGWTAYYCRHKYGADARAMRELQRFVNTLDRTKKYYTIVQYDNGVITKLPFDCKIFAMSGFKIDYPLPLMCKAHPFSFQNERTVFASFIGGLTHQIRRSMMRYIRNREGFMSSNYRLTTQGFCELLSKSVFTLCPRGYGQTSFRMSEALQYGSIPVYISDEFIIPHKRPFDYGVLIEPHQIRNIENILRKFTPEQIKEMQEKGKRAYKELFSYEGSKKLILENL